MSCLRHDVTHLSLPFPTNNMPTRPWDMPPAQEIVELGIDEVGGQAALAPPEVGARVVCEAGLGVSGQVKTSFSTGWFVPPFGGWF